MKPPRSGKNVPRAVLLAAVLVFSVAGCLTVEPTADPTPSTPQTNRAALIPWGLEDCTFIVANLPVDTARLQARMPAGWSPRPYSTLEGIEIGSRLGVESFACKQGTGLNGKINDLAYASIFASVNPPAEYRIQGVDAFFLKWEVLIPDEDRREHLLAAGVPARDGLTSVTLSRTAAGAATVDAQTTIEGFGTITFRSATDPMVSTSEFSFIEYTETPDGFVAWRGNATGTDVSRIIAEVTVPAGSWVADLMGASTIVTTSGGTGSYSFTNATITKPAPRFA
jgi:hypothetical protein